MRPTWDQHFLNIAKEVATMGTCHRRQVGCVIVDYRNRILSTGFNGTPPGWPHCRYSELSRCPGADSPSGTNVDECWANHAEQNAVTYCSDIESANTCYTTTSPCISCVRVLLCTNISRIVFLEEYPHKSKDLWVRYPVKVQLNGRHSLIPRSWEQLLPNGRLKTLAASDIRP